MVPTTVDITNLVHDVHVPLLYFGNYVSVAKVMQEFLVPNSSVTFKFSVPSLP